MRKVVDIALPPVEAMDIALVREAAAEEAGIPLEAVRSARVLKRSIDARSRHPLFRLRVEVDTEEPVEETGPVFVQRDVSDAEPVIVVGCGPAGLFAALECISLGRKPIVLERGKDVRARRRDLAAINREHIVDPDSNYCFGEGGAGTYSDGKLYTRSDKRGDVAGVLRTLVAFGAPADIQVDAHPHIGTNKLPGIVTAMRTAIETCGGEVRFGARVTGFLRHTGMTTGVQVNERDEIFANAVILATGHSARDIFHLLYSSGLLIEAKPFALGVRIEHPQEVIDRIRYRTAARDPLLPPASYSVVHQVDGAGVYSFCMCPGGIIAPCATAPGEVVTNGWSPSKRNNPFANSGIVVETQVKSDDPLAGLHFQQEVERSAWVHGGRTQAAPAQRMEDFIHGRSSRDLPECSYQPGIVCTDLRSVLPDHVFRRLRGGLLAFGHKMPGYMTNEAVLVATESRTSSPVRVPRDADTLQHPDLRGLFPCGEGAGYAGGIVSAAMDGVRVARAACALA